MADLDIRVLPVETREWLLRLEPKTPTSSEAEVLSLSEDVLKKKLSVWSQAKPRGTWQALDLLQHVVAIVHHFPAMAQIIVKEIYAAKEEEGQETLREFLCSIKPDHIDDSGSQEKIAEQVFTAALLNYGDNIYTYQTRITGMQKLPEVVFAQHHVAIAERLQDNRGATARQIDNDTNGRNPHKIPGHISIEHAQLIIQRWDLDAERRKLNDDNPRTALSYQALKVPERLNTASLEAGPDEVAVAKIKLNQTRNALVASTIFLPLKGESATHFNTFYAKGQSLRQYVGEVLNNTITFVNYFLGKLVVFYKASQSTPEDVSQKKPSQSSHLAPPPPPPPAPSSAPPPPPPPPPLVSSPSASNTVGAIMVGNNHVSSSYMAAVLPPLLSSNSAPPPPLPAQAPSTPGNESRTSSAAGPGSAAQSITSSVGPSNNGDTPNTPGVNSNVGGGSSARGGSISGGRGGADGSRTPDRPSPRGGAYGVSPPPVNPHQFVLPGGGNVGSPIPIGPYQQPSLLRGDGYGGSPVPVSPHQSRSSQYQSPFPRSTYGGLSPHQPPSQGSGHGGLYQSLSPHGNGVSGVNSLSNVHIYPSAGAPSSSGLANATTAVINGHGTNPGAGRGRGGPAFRGTNKE